MLRAHRMVTKILERNGSKQIEQESERHGNTLKVLSDRRNGKIAGLDKTQSSVKRKRSHHPSVRTQVWWWHQLFAKSPNLKAV